jgi:hypothetical protein
MITDIIDIIIAAIAPAFRHHEATSPLAWYNAIRPSRRRRTSPRGHLRASYCMHGIISSIIWRSVLYNPISAPFPPPLSINDMLVLHLEQRQEEDTLQVANDVSVLCKAILCYTYIILFYIPYIKQQTYYIHMFAAARATAGAGAL